MAGDSYLVDTNILLRLVQEDSPEHEAIRRCTASLLRSGSTLFYTTQVLGEFWNVSTRPAERNGFGLSVSATDELATYIESKFILAADTAKTHSVWRKLIRSANVSGAQVHDARLIAAMRVHRIGSLLTMNVRDFLRYGDPIISPRDWLSAHE